MDTKRMWLGFDIELAKEIRMKMMYSARNISFIFVGLRKAMTETMISSFINSIVFLYTQLVLGWLDDLTWRESI